MGYGSAMWALVPLKQLEQAKARLASVLSPDERRALMLAMARDVLTALSRSRLVRGILLVSRTPEADALAQAFATERFAESPHADLSTALMQASEYLAAQLNADGVMIVPADVPAITPEEVDSIISRHHRITVIPDDEHVGTNCLICSPPNCIPYLFDGLSFKPHLDAAAAAGITPTVIPSADFALDVDTPRDLEVLVARNPDSQTVSYLARSGIVQRLQRAAEPRRARTDGP